MEHRPPPEKKHHRFHGVITIQAVRDYLLDRSPEDNETEGDLAFSDKEILGAMTSAARDSNSIPPYVDNVQPGQLPDNTNIYFDGITKHLYRAQIARLIRDDFDYEAAGVTANLVKKRIEHYTRLQAEADKSFKEAIKARKLLLNISRGYGQVG